VTLSISLDCASAEPTITRWARSNGHDRSARNGAIIVDFTSWTRRIRYKARRSPPILEIRPGLPAPLRSPIRLQLRLSHGGTGLEITLGMNAAETRPNGDLMRKLIGALLAGLMASTSVVVAAEADAAVPFAVVAPEELEMSARPLVTAAVREANRVAPAPSAFRQTPAEQSPPEMKPWMERHPVWFGLIAGASVGATWGALSCRNGCFPIGASGAAMVGSWWGAGAGALIGFGVGRAN